MNQMNNQSSTDDCQIALDVVTNPFAQFARAIIILFNFATLFCLIFLILEYKRTKLALHGNLKLLYLNILIFYAIGTIGYFMAEFRNIIISISSSNDPCGMLTPAWFAFLSRMLQFFQSIGITFSHLAVMIERIRATLLAHNYEWEGIKFGIISIIFVYAINFFLLFLIGNTVLADWEWYIQKMLPMNSMATKNSNQLVIYIHFLMLFFIALTAFGDYILFKKNKQRRIKNTTSAGDGRRVVEYNLSENYQLNENINAIRLILPLDIAYLLFMSMYLAMVIVLRMFQVIIPQSTFLAYYNLITLSLLSYAIISLLFYRKFLRMNKSRLATNIVMAQMDMGNAYFQQFQTQWR